jgi:hypothetical protein
MKSFYITIRQSRWLRLLTLAILGIVSASAYADDTVDLGEINLNTEYSVAAYKGFVAHFTAPKSGTLTVTPPDFAVYTNEDLAAANKLSASNTGALYTNTTETQKYQQYNEYQVTEGQTYWLYTSFTWDASVLEITMPSSLSLDEASVAEGSQLSASGYGAVDYKFSQAVTVSKASLISGENTAELETRIQGNVLTAVYAETLKEWLNNGTVQAGDKLTIKLEGVASSSDASLLYNGDGVASFDYVAAAAPITLESATAGDGAYKLVVSGTAETDFLSYFRPTDSRGKFVFTFSAPIDPEKGSFQLQYGSSESDSGSGDYYYVGDLKAAGKVEFSNDNKTITLDLTGVLRDPKSMITSGSTYSEIIVHLGYITGADGQLVYTGASGSEGSFDFVFNYKVLSSVASAEFEEKDKIGESVEIYVSSYSEVDFDGITFSWRENGENKSAAVAKADLTLTTDEYDGATIVVAVPADVQAKNNVTVSFTNISFADGLEHSGFEQTYNVVDYTVDTDLVVTYTPNTDAAVESVDKVVLNFQGYDNVTYRSGQAQMLGRSATSYVFLDTPTAGESGSQLIQPVTGATKSDTYTITFPEGYFELANNVVNPVFTATFIVNNGVVVKSIETDPADGATVESCDEIVITFNDYETASLGSGKATISKDGGEAQNLGDAGWGVADNQMKQPLGGLAAENGTYTVTFPAGYFNLGDDDTSEEIVVTFTVGAAKELEVKVVSNPENGATVESCDKLDLTFPEYGTVSEGAGKAIISRRGDIEFGEKELGSTEWGAELNEIVQPLGDLAEEEGMYIVSFPAGYFLLGVDEDDTDPINSPAIVLTFIVEKEKTVELEFTSTPAEGSTVESADQIVITFTNQLSASPSWNGSVAKLTSSLSDDVIGLKDATYGEDNVFNQVIQPLDGNAAADGTYTVTFPKGYFQLFPDEYSDGIDSPEFTITFDVEKPVVLNITTDPVSGSTVESIDEFVITFDDYAYVDKLYQGTPTISRRGDTEFGEQELSETDYGSGFNQMKQSLDGLAEEEGMYIISYPAGYFGGSEDINTFKTNHEEIPAFTVTFVVEKPKAEVDLEFESVPKNNSRVGKVESIDIIFTQYGAANASWNGSKPTISKNNGEPVEINAEPEWGTELNEMVQNLDATYDYLVEADWGTYVVSFPAGYFLLGVDEDDANPIDSPAFTITFTLDATSGISDITVGGEGAEYFNLQGIKVENPEHGIYIVRRGNTTTKVLRTK